MLHRRRIYTRILPLSKGQKVRLRAIVLHLVKCHSFYKPPQCQKTPDFRRCKEKKWCCLECPSCVPGTKWIRSSTAGLFWNHCSTVSVCWVSFYVLRHTLVHEYIHPLLTRHSLFIQNTVLLQPSAPVGWISLRSLCWYEQWVTGKRKKGG